MDVYTNADKRIEDFLSWIAYRFDQIRNSTDERSDTLAVFDELNTLYGQINSYSREVFLSILQEAYDAEVKNRRRRFDEDFLILILDEPDDFTTVTFSRELTRRAERMGEQIAAAINRRLQSEDRTNENGVTIPLETELQTIFDREYNSIALLLDSTSVSTVDTGRKYAFEDDDVRRVRWVTILDGKECDYCRHLNGHIFPINRIPTKPHPHCRCYTIRFDYKYSWD